tara:strand:- start:646 stop:846 length:201 start_codon:yes stop_codon:yes gene_type:complete
MEEDKCCVCGSNLRVINKRMEFLGLVCSVCFRMSRKNYIRQVELMALKKIEMIMNEVNRIREITIL